MKHFLSFILAVYAIASVATPAAPPNVLMIAIDDLRPELGCYGDSHVHSPNIDALAASGRLFQRAYCQQAVCNPSRASLMTGLRPDSIGVTGNHIHFRSNRPDVVTLSQHFMRHGYHAQAIGKIYHGFLPVGTSKTTWDTLGDAPSWSVPATRFGPRYYYTETGIEQAKQAYVKMYRAKDPGPDDWAEKLVFGPMTEAPEVPDEILHDGKVAAKAVETLASLAGTEQPFFLAVGFIKPHSPFVAPKKYWDLYDPSNITLASERTLPVDAPSLAGHRSGEIRRYTDQPNRGEIPPENQLRMKHGYYACISFVDAQIGKVLQALHDNGLANDTIVVLFGDHGYHLGDKGLWGKTTNFELDTRVPLIIRVPGIKQPGTPTRSLAELVDLYPTLADLAGLPIADDLEGTSLAPVMNDSSAAPDEFAISQFPRGKAMGYSLRTDRWRYTEWIENGEAIAHELYDHQNDDAEEVQSIAARNQKLVSQLSDQLRTAAGPPQKIVSVTVDDIEVPVLIGVDRNPLLRIRIEANGTHQPLSVTSINASISGTATADDIGKVELLVAEDLVQSQKNVSRFGERSLGIGELKFSGQHHLKHGTNLLWLSCSLKEGANIDHTLQATCKRINFSKGASYEPQNEDVPHRLGVAVRQSGQDGVHTSRIPGLATTNQGTLIGVYDLRHRGSGDLPGDIDVGMSRSTDGGRTWEKTRTIMDMGDEKQWRYDGIGDPAVLVDKNTGTIWVAATWSHGNRSWTGSGPGLTPEETGQFILVRSDDDGVTWSDPINITKQIKQPEWCFLLAGPGNGITMRDGTLVFAAQFQLPENQNRQPFSTIVYSTDHGKTWQIGTGAHADTTEAQVVEIEPGKLMLNCRYNKGNVRVVMTTDDMGKTWQEHPTSKRALIEPRSCMASLIDAGHWLLFSNPNHTKSRQRITIKASSDRGQTWPKTNQLLLDEGRGAGYSCLTMIDPTTIGILYEGSRGQLTFQRMPLSELTNQELSIHGR